MRTVTTSDAVLAVSASRFGYPGVLAEFIAAASTPRQAAELAATLGEIAAAVDGVNIALSGRSPSRREQTRPSDRSPDVSAMADLVVRLASESDVDAVDTVCSEAARAGRLSALLCSLVSGINDGLDCLDRLPGPGASGFLQRLGLAAATRVG